MYGHIGTRQAGEKISGGGWVCGRVGIQFSIFPKHCHVGVTHGTVVLYRSRHTGSRHALGYRVMMCIAPRLLDHDAGRESVHVTHLLLVCHTCHYHFPHWEFNSSSPDASVSFKDLAEREGTMDYRAKADEINLVLSEPNVNLWKLRELALTEGGLVNGKNICDSREFCPCHWMILNDAHPFWGWRRQSSQTCVAQVGRTS